MTKRVTDYILSRLVYSYAKNYKDKILTLVNDQIDFYGKSSPSLFTQHSQDNALLYSGINGEASFVDRVNLINTFKLITPTSPHSSYSPYEAEFTQILKDVAGYKK